MKHNIYISVSEFLENGGKLLPGREIYKYMYGYHIAGHFVAVEGSTLHVDLEDEQVYIELRAASVCVGCKPIYK